MADPLYPIDSDDVLILKGDGVDDGTDIIDSSLHGHSPTVVGSAVTSTDQYVFDQETASSLLLPSGSYITTPYDSSFLFYTGTTNSWTIDFWVRFNSVGALAFWSIFENTGKWLTSYYDGSNIIVRGDYNSNVQFFKAAWAPSADTWYHVAMARTTSVRYIWVNGTPLTLWGTNKNNNMTGLNAPFYLGYFQLFPYYLNGYIDEFRIKDALSWSGSFTPPSEPYGYAPITTDSDVDGYVDGRSISRDRYVRKPRSQGFSVTPGMDVPVPIKMDKWQNINTPPVRTRKKSPATGITIAYVDFSIPTPPPVYMDMWLSQFDIPRREKKITLPTAFAISFISALNPVNGNYWDSGVVGIRITEEGDESQTYADHETLSFTITSTNTEDFQLEEHESISFTIKNPVQGNESYSIGIPGYIAANVIIDGVNKSGFIQGSLNVTRADNTAARFKVSLEEDPDLLVPIKPVEYVNKIISISFAAADMTGQVADYIPIFVGIIKKVSFNEDHRTMNLSGYDYSGIHQTPGEYVSQNITEVFTGNAYGNVATTISTGHSPIWGVVFSGNVAVTDGEDYFVDTQNGLIIIPISSRILQFPGSFAYNYSNPMASMEAIIEAVINIKGWTIATDNTVIADYTNTAAHPVLSLSDESVIDTCRKFLECSGAKVEGNLFPDLRVYSEVENWINPTNTVTVDESIIFQNTLVITVDFDNLLNEQTVRSVQKVNANIEIGASTQIAQFSGSQQSINPFTIQGGNNINGIDYQTPSVLVEKRINKQNLNSISFVSSGAFTLWWFYSSYYEAITGASWSSFVDGDDFVIQLKHNVVTAGGNPGGTSFQSGFSTVHAFPAVEYDLTVYGSKITYGGGLTEDIRVVTAQRPVSGISETLKGDVYENAYIETDGHCANICNAVLLEHGNPYTVQMEIPLYQGPNAQIGHKLNIERDGNIIFSGIIKTLSYTINTGTGVNALMVRAKGVGRGI